MSNDDSTSSRTLKPSTHPLLNILECLSHLQKLIAQHEIDQISIKNEWEFHFTTLKDAARDLSVKVEKIQKRYEELINKNRKTIKRQNKKLKQASLLFKILKRSVNILRPRIGVLYQYNNSTPLIIPRRYYIQSKLPNPPTISIVTPSFNQGEFIEKTILSVLGQKYPRLEYIIQDGSSTDATVDIIQRYAPSITHWESKPDSGQSNAINLGFQRTTGEIMAYLNSDDILLPGTLAYVAKYFSKHPDIDVVYGHRVVIDEYDHEVGRWILPPHDSDVLSWSDYVPQETLFWRRSIWEKTGGKIDEKFRFAMDWDLLVRFRDAGAKLMRLPRFLGAFRVHSQQKTSSQIHQIGAKEMQEIRKRCLGRYVAGTEVNEYIRPYQIRHLVYHGLYRFGVVRY